MNNDTQLPLVSVITVNYNTDEVTAALLASLRNVTYPNLEVIVVDNASKVNCDYLKTAFPEITFIQNEVNEGFAGGNNRGIEKASGEIVFLLNNDTEVIPGFIEPVIELFKTDQSIGIISPKIRYYHLPGVIQYAGGEPINPFTARGKFIGTGQADRGQFQMPVKTQLGHGAAMAIRRTVFDKIGLLPENYFLYYEELDFCVHAQKAGFSIWYQPASLVLHKESMSVGKLSSIKVYYQNRNRLLFIRRNIKGLQGFISRMFFVLISAPVAMFRYLLSDTPGYANEIWKGLIWNFRNNAR
ncbi:glycosyltransferase family 2 protein [Mucilaginibacter celer]|uniref:Glycosyltransferase n=1 Tax=Mucilaginibacter celer TaxID=2305508 RepID=A0A494VUQ5_9SPHI|nr:glycosyltransferase family 2 protein [Mucilaginibacter celer]AYL95163.1 glycosyltransferase [Mucilaginibacter celer]